MGSRRLSGLAFTPSDTAALKRGVSSAARFGYRRVALPAADFVLDSVESLFNFIDEFADSIDEVRAAMARARSERYTISAHRR